MTRRSSAEDRQTFTACDGFLVRTACRRDGSSYQHRCSLAAYTAVAGYLKEHAAEGVTTNALWDHLPEIPCTQAAIALAFLKERGCVVVCRRRCYPASRFFYEDALLEWYALAETQQT